MVSLSNACNEQKVEAVEVVILKDTKQFSPDRLHSDIDDRGWADLGRNVPHRRDRERGVPGPQ